MNERITDLAEQAGLLGPSSRVGNAHACAERFADLIVAEVLAVQEKFIADGHNAWHLNKPTREHFGVEA